MGMTSGSDAEIITSAHPAAAALGPLFERHFDVVYRYLARRVGPQLAEELMAYCRQHLSTLKCPRSIDFEAELPRHPTGKLYKRLLRDRYWGKHETRIV